MLDLAVNMGKQAVERFFHRSGNQKGDEELEPVSIGLAVAYYYNFLDPVASVIRRDEFSLFSSTNGGEPSRFRSEDVRIQIIMPQRLDVYSFQKCENELKELQKGFIYLDQGRRYYGINYALTDLPSRTEIMIVDLARSLVTVKRYYEDIVGLRTFPETDEWTKIQVAERTAFRETLRELQRRGYSALVNNLDFRET